MRFAILGSGAVGGYYGAKLSRAGHEVVFIARGAHLKAIRDRGLWIWSVLGDFIATARAEEDPAAVGPVDVVLVTVKAYDNEKALASLAPLVGPQTTVLTLQNGIESAEQVAAVAGEASVIAGSAYIATAIRAPGLIEQTGTHRRIVFGEWFGERPSVSPRVSAIHEAFAAADIESEPHADARPRVWEKFIWLAPLAAVCAAARQPTAALQNDAALKQTLLAAVGEADALARAEGIAVSPDIVEQGTEYFEKLPPSMRPSMFIDLSIGKPMELDALVGAVVRRSASHRVATPVSSTLYAVLKPYAAGSRP